jgi:hypothetical protein
MADNIQVDKDGRPIPHREDVLRETARQNALSSRRALPERETTTPSAKTGFKRVIRDGLSTLMNAGLIAGALYAAAPDKDSITPSHPAITQDSETSAPETSIRPKPRP